MKVSDAKTQKPGCLKNGWHSGGAVEGSWGQNEGVKALGGKGP